MSFLTNNITVYIRLGMLSPSNIPQSQPELELVEIATWKTYVYSGRRLRGGLDA